LKEERPGAAGEDFDAYIEAELLLCKGKLTKAARRYDKLLDDYPESGLKDAAMERLFEIGTDYLGGRKKRVLKIFKVRGYAEGVRIMEKISDRAGTAEISQRAAVAVVRHYERRGKWEDAYLKWSEVSSRWPLGDVGRESLLGMARAKYAAYKGSEYDVSGIVSAKSYYENFRLRYSEEAGEIGVDRIIEDIDAELAAKELDTARYYAGTGGREAANMYYQMVIDKWPVSEAAAAAREEMAKPEPEKKEDTWLKKLERLVL
jgi:outer membrane protein assembly factor BamD (BamD/ComL family)